MIQKSVRKPRFPKGKLAIVISSICIVVVIVILIQQLGLIPSISPPKHDLYAAASVGEAY